jgi:hypothetical protein
MNDNMYCLGLYKVQHYSMVTVYDLYVANSLVAEAPTMRKNRASWGSELSDPDDATGSASQLQTPEFYRLFPQSFGIGICSDVDIETVQLISQEPGKPIS